MIEWKEAYATGNEAIDKQHRLLFDIFNDFEVAINEGRGDVYLRRCFPMLESYAQAHFKFEENCMMEHKCPVSHKNKMAHQMFLCSLQEYKKMFESSKAKDSLYVDMHKFIEQWIVNHIIGVDTHLKACMNN